MRLHLGSQAYALVSVLFLAACGVGAAPDGMDGRATSSVSWTAISPIRLLDSTEYEVSGRDGVGVGHYDPGLRDFGVGDTGSPVADGCDLDRRGVVNFDISSLLGKRVATARLELTILQSRKDQYPAPGIVDDSPPFINPGLGAVRVINIAAATTPTDAVYQTASIGNDPGVLVPRNTTPGAAVAIDVTRALNQALAAESGVVSFRVQTDKGTDLDCLNDVWFFASSLALDPALRPYIELEVAPAIEVSVEAARIALPKGGTTGEVQVRGEFWASLPSHNVNIVLTLDGKNLFAEPFSSFFRVGRSEAYMLLQRGILAWFDFGGGEFYVVASKANLSGFEPSNGVEIELRIGSDVGGQTIPMTPQGRHTWKYDRPRK